MQPPLWKLVGMMVFCSELFLIISKWNKIEIIAKAKRQRSESEKKEIDRGLVRSFILEALLYVPANAVLFFVAIRSLLFPIMPVRAVADRTPWWGFYGLLGISSYKFPYSAFKKRITNVANETVFAFISSIAKEMSQTETASKKEELSKETGAGN